MPTCLRFDAVSRRISTDESLVAAGAPSAMHADLQTDTLYIAAGTAIRPSHSGQVLSATWRSKVFKIPSGARGGFAWARLRGSFTVGVTLNFYADGVLRHSKSNVKTLEPLRMPALEGRAWEVEIVGPDRVTGLVLTDSAEGLLT